MKRILLILFLLFSCSDEIIEDVENIEYQYTYNVIETELITEINEFRFENNLPILEISNYTSIVSLEHVEYMISVNQLLHDGFPIRIQLLRDNINANKVGEVLGYGYGSASGVLNGWVNSESHLKVLKNSLYTHMGVVSRVDYNNRNYFMVILINFQ